MSNKINLYNDKKFGISIWSVDIDEGLPISGMLVNWIKNIKCVYNVVERKRRQSTIPKVTNKKN